MNSVKVYLAFLCSVVIILVYIHFYVENSLATRSTPSPVRQDDRKQSVVFYNRIPKTGSTSLMNIAYELHAQNRYRVVQVRLKGSKHVLSLADQNSMSRNVSAWSDLPMLLHGHFSYFDPHVLGSDLIPVYINLIRKPIERLVSYYYFLRYGDDILVDKVRSKAGDTTTFDECVEKGHPDCDPSKLWMQIPFFCGSSPHCWDPGSHWALEQAKQNLVNKYLVVGMTEDLESFVEVLEVLLPQYFHGAPQYLSDSGKAHIKKTKHKDPVSESTLQTLRSSKIYQLEIEFYNFAVKQFKAIKKSANTWKERGKSFVYEKVKPKM